ncbi:MAG TPA: hypothetical protein VGL81_07790 [Polyangiaceae bacterium]|jgi:hypothetical protein
MSHDLTPKQQANVLAAVRFLRVRCGGWEPLAKALHFTPVTLRKPASPAVAFRVAKLACIGVDDLLAGKFPPPGVCPHCGATKGETAPE